MGIRFSEHPWDHILVDEFLTKRELRSIAHHIDKVSKMGDVDITHVTEGPFKILKDRVHELLNIREVKNKFRVREPFQITLTISKQTDGVKIVNKDKICTMFFNITPFREDENFISLSVGTNHQEKKIKCGVIVSTSGEYKPYTFINVDKLITLSVNLIDLGKPLDLVNKKYEVDVRESLLGGALIYKDEFTIISKYKCGSSTIEKWYENATIDKGLFKSNIRYNNNLKFEYFLNTKDKIFIVRNPYERFFSGLLQTRVFGFFDVYKTRRDKESTNYTIPFNLIDNDFIIKTLKNSILHNPSFLYDKHITPYMVDYYQFISSNPTHNCKVVDLKDLTKTIYTLKEKYDIGGELIQVDMRGESYKDISITQVINDFFKLLRLHDNNDELRHLLDLLEQEDNAYRKLLKWT